MFLIKVDQGVSVTGAMWTLHNVSFSKKNQGVSLMGLTHVPASTQESHCSGCFRSRSATTRLRAPHWALLVGTSMRPATLGTSTP